MGSEGELVKRSSGKIIMFSTGAIIQHLGLWCDMKGSCVRLYYAPWMIPPLLVAWLHSNIPTRLPTCMLITPPPSAEVMWKCLIDNFGQPLPAYLDSMSFRVKLQYAENSEKDLIIFTRHSYDTTHSMRPLLLSRQSPGGGGGYHMLRYIWMCCSNELLFLQEIPKHGSHLLQRYP